MVSGQVNRNDGQTFKDVREITSKEVLEQMKEGYSFKTSAPSLADYEELFKKTSEEHNVIHLSMGEGLSRASLNSASLTANDINPQKIQVIDAKNGATGGTFLYLYVKHLIKEKLPFNEIVLKVKKIRDYLKTAFFVPDPSGFKRSGRDSSELCIKEKALIIGSKALSLAGMKFRVDFNQDGNLYARQTMMGKANLKAIQMIKDIVNEDTIHLYDNRLAVIGTILENKVNMKDIENYLKQFFKTVVRQDINAVVAAYGSADLVGLSLCRKLD